MNKKVYDAEYHKKNIKGVYIPFNMNNPEDAELLKWAKCYPNVTQYIKSLIRRDMALQGGFEN